MAFCTNCGMPVPENEPICPACGKVMGGFASEPETPSVLPTSQGPSPEPSFGPPSPQPIISGPPPSQPPLSEPSSFGPPSFQTIPPDMPSSQGPSSGSFTGPDVGAPAGASSPQMMPPNAPPPGYIPQDSYAYPNNAAPAAGESPAAAKPPKGGRFGVVSTFGFILNYILLAIPLIGLVFMFVWAFSKNVNMNRRNMARANLVLFIFGLILALAGVILFFACFGGSFDAIGEWFTAFIDIFRVR